MMRRAILLALLLLALGACGPLVQIGGNAPPPDALLTITADAGTVPLPAGTVDRSRAITIGLPVVPGALQTLRLPVQIADTQVQYLVKANWAEQPNRLFQRLLADRLSGAGTPVLDARTGTAAGRTLAGELAVFGLDSRSGAVVARVRYDALLTTAAGSRIRRFEASEPAATTGPDAAAALNRAANRVAGDVVAWVNGGRGERPCRCKHPPPYRRALAATLSGRSSANTRW
jgi:cholesterol transport system auxiliary component